MHKLWIKRYRRETAVLLPSTFALLKVNELASNWQTDRDRYNQSHSFIQDISIAPLQVHYYSEALPTTERCYSVGVNTPKRYRQLSVKDLFMVPKVGFELATFQTQGTETTTESPRHIDRHFDKSKWIKEWQRERQTERWTGRQT